MISFFININIQIKIIKAKHNQGINQELSFTMNQIKFKKLKLAKLLQWGADNAFCPARHNLIAAWLAILQIE